MGFGTLYIGYFLLLNLTYYAFTDLIAALIMAMALSKLSAVEKNLKPALYFSIVFAIIGCVLYGLILDNVTDLTANYFVLAMLGLILSVISQIGDLWASLIKREHGIKDYSSMLPGHGGVMDRFDSILAISTVLMAVCMAFPPFN